jgi:hypothetical protein
MDWEKIQNCHNLRRDSNITPPENKFKALPTER